jgi:alpha-beta hydrolase superfamily lysophospholipase
MKIVRTPLFFGPEARSLFGWFHARSDGGRTDLAVVICPPLGHEYANSHRPIRHLADRLAEAGIPVLRFDYEGSGDSSGRDEDRQRVGAWTHSVHEAIAALGQLSGCRKIGLVGVRLGATLAFVAATQSDVPCLVLWAPCVRGRSYAHEMKALHLTGAKSNAATADGHIEPAGYVMTNETQRDIEYLDLGAACPRTQRALIVTRDDVGEDSRLRDKWMDAGIETTQYAVPGFTEMFLPPHSATVPDRAINITVEWITADLAMTARVLPSHGTRSEQRITDGDPAVEIRESIVNCDGCLFGILSEPVKPVHHETPTILMPNAGSVHHVGPNRLYVLLARRLAGAGFRCLRFDLPGLGDCVAREITQENIPYLTSASSVVAAAITAMQHRKSAAFVLIGLCSGAHTSFHAALDLDRAPILESVMINPLTFYFTPGMPLDPSPTKRYDGWQRQMLSIGSLERWAKLLRRHLRIAFFRFRDIRPTTALALGRAASKNNGGPHGHDLESDLRAIVQRGRKLAFIFARFDPGYDLLMINAASVVKKFQKSGLIKLVLIDDANHTFEAKHSREIMFDSVVNHLVDRYASTHYAQ